MILEGVLTTLDCLSWRAGTIQFRLLTTFLVRRQTELTTWCFLRRIGYGLLPPFSLEQRTSESGLGRLVAFAETAKLTRVI